MMLAFVMQAVPMSRPETPHQTRARAAGLARASTTVHRIAA